MTRIERQPVPPRVRTLAGLERVDYADHFSVSVAGEPSPLDMLHRLVEAQPILVRGVRLAHHALGLTLAPAHSADHPIGWTLLRDDPHEAVLGTAGLLGTARIVGLTEAGRFSLATLIQFNGGVGRVMWAFAAPVHRPATRTALGILSRIPPATPVPPATPE